MDIKFIQSKLKSSIDLKSAMLQDEELMQTVVDASKKIIDCFKNGGKVFWCGNGGSAADAQHLSAELSGRFYFDRAPLFSEALHVNTSYVTAVANDYSYDVIYSRLISGFAKEGDILIGLSTSGNSKNVVNAMKKCNEMGVTTIGFTGETGGEMKNCSDILIPIPSTDTPRIQECHMILGHTLCEITEIEIFK